MNLEKRPTCGLALSGGGSRAAAFHRGTLRGLLDLDLVQRVDVISTVSGGSVFGGAWMAARMNGMADGEFLGSLEQELGKGFVLRSIRPRLLKALVPGNNYTRTNVIADTFDELFFGGRSLADLPCAPRLCINTTVLENGQVGKFSKEGFSLFDLQFEGAEPSHQLPISDFPIAVAVAASAAFPVGLPPVQLRAGDLPAGTRFVRTLEGARTVTLTDGGVLENLGVQTLLRSRRWGAWDLIVSDAGTAEMRWSSSSVWNSLRGFGVWVLSGRILDRLMLVMNDKQNRWARQQVIEEVQLSWLAELLREGAESRGGIDVFLNKMLWADQRIGERVPLPRRNVLFVRVNQSWDRFMTSIPGYRLTELTGTTDRHPRDPNEIEAALVEAGVDLNAAREYYQKTGEAEGVVAVNKVGTGFTALKDKVIEQLEAHAAWQVHATHAIYGL